MRMVATAIVIVAALAGTSAARTAGEARKAAWLSVAHPGLGEYYNAGWGDFFERCPQKKFWLGLIPIYGWPGYLQIRSAIDAYHGCTSDNLTAGCTGPRRARHAAASSSTSDATTAKPPSQKAGSSTSTSSRRRRTSGASEPPAPSRSR